LIKAVIFDLGGVMLKGNIQKFLEKGEQILETRAKHGNDACFDRKLNMGTSSLRTAFERAFEKKMFDHEFIPLMKAWLKNWEIDNDMLAFAKTLGKGYKLAVLSNSELSFEEKYGDQLKKVFSPIVYSHRERMVKPDKAIFELTLKKLGLEPEECIMVDDAMENGNTCRALGIHFVLFKNLEKLKKDLELHGVRA